MKRIGVTLAIGVLLLIALYSYALAEPDDTASHSFILPDSLVRIEEEAFLGTAAEMVVLPDNVEYIGARAAAGMPNLKTVFIPESTAFIDDSAFDNSPEDLAIVGVAGSYAHKWATEHGFAFINIDIWFAGTDEFNAGSQQTIDRRSSVSDDLEAKIEAMTRIVRRECIENRAMSPQDRAELQVIDYRFP